MATNRLWTQILQELFTILNLQQSNFIEICFNFSGEQVASESIRLDAPLAGHAAIEIDLSERILGRNFSCFTVSMT